MKYIILLLLLATPVISATEEMVTLARLLNTSDELRTALLIDYVVEELIDYKYYYDPREKRLTWEQKEGDCTDKAFIKRFMMHSIGIRSRIVYGSIYDMKHDSLEVNINNTWISTDVTYFKKIGIGWW